MGKDFQGLLWSNEKTPCIEYQKKESDMKKPQMVLTEAYFVVRLDSIGEMKCFTA